MRKIVLLTSFILIFCQMTSGELVIKYDFFGIAMNSVEDAKNFTITGYYNDGSIEYTTSNKRTMNSDISARAFISKNSEYYYVGSSLSLWVVNKSNKPISTNYFSDKFTMVTKQGKAYIIEKQSISNYYSKSYINPDSDAYFRFSGPTIEKIGKDDVEIIVCNLGGVYGTTIVLKPLPELSSKAKENTPPK